LYSYLRDTTLGLKPFQPRLLLNPFYIIAKIKTVHSWNDLVWRFGDLCVNLRAAWRTGARRLRSSEASPKHACELVGLSARQKVLERWALGRGLDIGCGAASVLPGRVDTVDFDPRWRSQVDFFSSCDAIPVNDAHYDFAAASHVLEHLRNPIAALHEWSRILRPGGKLILFLPDCRLYIPDRKRLDAAEPPADTGTLREIFLRGEPNAPALKEQEEGIGRSWTQRYCKHHYLWRAEPACSLLKLSGFGVIRAEESSDGFVKAFNEELLPRYASRRFIESSDCGPLMMEILAMQRRLREAMLDYSVIIVAAKPG
jgi:SAM-dependent methyltransferase